MSAPDQSAWFSILEPRQKSLVEQSRWLLREAEATASNQDEVDYGYVLFPIAKAYEGFLKRYFFQLGLVTETMYKSHRFRIGRALNPDVRAEHRNGEWLFDDLERECHGGVARQLWEAWLMGRNQVFHYFPDRDNLITFDQAKKNLHLIESAMAAAINCQLQNPTDFQSR